METYPAPTLHLGPFQIQNNNSWKWSGGFYQGTRTGASRHQCIHGIQHYLAGVLGAVPHKYPLYRAYTGISHGHSYVGSGTLNYPLILGSAICWILPQLDKYWKALRCMIWVNQLAMCPISVLIRESPSRFVVGEIKFTNSPWYIAFPFCFLSCGIARQNKWPTTFDYSKSYLHVDELWQ